MNALQLSPQDVTDFYTPLITDLMAVTQSMAGVIEDAQMLQAILSYVGVLEGKERSGHERSAGTLGFGSGGFSPELYRDFTRLAAMQEVFFRALQESGHADDIAAFEAVMSGPAGVAVSELRMLVSRDPSGPQIAAVSPAQWFEAATQRIDGLKALEDQMSQRIADTASANLAVAQRNFWMLAGVLAALIVLTGFVSFFVAKSIAPPIRKLAATMRELAANNFKVTVEDTWRTDEIGDMAKAVEIFRENGIDRINLEKRAQSERDHERMRQVHIEKIVSSFRTQIAASSNEVVGHTDAMRSLAERLLGVARTAAQDAQSAHTASNGASSNVQTVAAATEELSASIREIAGQTHRVSTLMDSAAQRADATNADVAKLSEAAKHIGAVIGLISDIAEQTNLLALNATIEAARAGEAGRGFAVVASEVKELATQTARATEEISQQIAGIQASTTGAVDSIGSITRAVNEIRELTTAIAGAVEEQEAATQEIANSVGAASNGTESAASNVESVSRSIENTAEEAKTVNATADLLAGTSASLLENVENFLAQVSRDVDDRRGALRVKMSEIIVICAAGRRRRSTMLDASKTGAKIAPVEGVQIGDEVKVELADGSTVTGKARRFAEGGIGIEFSEAIDDPVSFIGQGFHDEKAA